MSPYSDIAYIHINGNKWLCHYERLVNFTELTNKCQRQSKATVPPPMTYYHPWDVSNSSSVIQVSSKG